MAIAIEQAFCLVSTLTIATPGGEGWSGLDAWTAAMMDAGRCALLIAVLRLAMKDPRSEIEIQKPEAIAEQKRDVHWN